MAAEKKNRHGLTEKELREVGDIEVNMWSITKPGGTPKTLKQHAIDRMSHAEKQRIFDEGMARDQSERTQAYIDRTGLHPDTGEKALTTQERIDAYIKQFPDTDPSTNQLLYDIVREPEYQDNGNWGPYGGKGGEISMVWLHEQIELENGAPTEISCMTFYVPKSTGN